MPNYCYGRCKPCHKIFHSKCAIKYRDKMYANAKVTIKEKECSICKLTLDSSEFDINRGNRDCLDSYCKPCRKDKRSKVMKYVEDLKKASKCGSCHIHGNVGDNWRIFDFAHFDREDKIKDKYGNTVDFSVLRTIKKVDEELPFGRFLCKNCHRKETKLENEKGLSMKSDAIYMRKKRGMYLMMINEEKLNRGHCIDCKMKVLEDFSNSSCFDFDHRNPSEKLFCVSQVYGKDKLDVLNEMKKCDLRCSNCHHLKSFYCNESGILGWRENSNSKRRKLNESLRSNVEQNENEKCKLN